MVFSSLKNNRQTRGITNDKQLPCISVGSDISLAKTLLVNKGKIGY